MCEPKTTNGGLDQITAFYLSLRRELKDAGMGQARLDQLMLMTGYGDLVTQCQSTCSIECGCKGGENGSDKRF